MSDPSLHEGECDFDGREWCRLCRATLADPMTRSTPSDPTHRPVLRAPSGSSDVQLECSCGWLWNEDDPVDLPEGEDFIRHLAALSTPPPSLDVRIEEMLAVRLSQGGLIPADVALIRAALSTPPPSLDANLIVGRLALGEPMGACWRASLATITGLDVPDISGPDWFSGSQAFLREHGWALEPSPAIRPVRGFSVAIGPASSGDSDHAMVALDGVVIWDPGTGRRDGVGFTPRSFAPTVFSPPSKGAPDDPA